MIGIDQLSIDDLLALNYRIVERLKFLENAQAHIDTMAFNLGSLVSLETEGGCHLGTPGEIQSQNRYCPNDGVHIWFPSLGQ